MAEDEDARALDSAINGSRFRSLNQRLWRAAVSYHFEAAARAPFTCECEDPDCREAVMLRLDEYERIRAQPTWFLLAAGHEDDESPHERVIEAENGYAIVEKTGAAGVEATRLWAREVGPV